MARPDFWTRRVRESAATISDVLLSRSLINKLTGKLVKFTVPGSESLEAHSEDHFSQANAVQTWCHLYARDRLTELFGESNRTCHTKGLDA